MRSLKLLATVVLCILCPGSLLLAQEGEVRGQVLYPEGTPAPGVKVGRGTLGRRMPYDPARDFPATTDENGRFVLPPGDRIGQLLAAGRPAILALDPEQQLAGVAFLEDPQQPVAVQLRQAGYLLAQVRDAQGRPLASVPAYVILGPAGLHWPSEWQSDARGQLRIGPLPPGVDLQVVTDTRLALDDAWSDLGNLLLTPGEERRLPPLRINPQGRSLKGLIVDAERQPVPGTQVSSPGVAQPVTAGQDGSFEISGLNQRGRVLLVAVHPRDLLFAAVQFDPDRGRRRTAAASSASLRLVLGPPGVVAGQVLDHEDHPVVGVQVRSGWHNDLAFPELERRLAQAGFREHVLTDGQGRFRLEGLIPGLPYTPSGMFLPPGASRAPLWPQDWWENRRVLVKPGETVDLGQIKPPWPPPPPGASGPPPMY